VIDYLEAGGQTVAELGFVDPALLVSFLAILSLVVFLFVQFSLILTLARHKLIAAAILGGMLLAMHAGALLL